MSTLIEEKDVTAVNLSVELERAVIAHRLDDEKSIYVTEDDLFPFWIEIKSSAKLIIFRSYTFCKKASSHLDRLELSNKMNYSQYMLTVSVNENKLIFDHALNYRDGVLRENFIRASRQFSTSIKTGLHSYDNDNVIALPPGRQEESDTEND